MKRLTLDEVVAALNEFYKENGMDRCLDYTYGFFDAMGVLRELINEEKMK